MKDDAMEPGRRVAGTLPAAPSPTYRFAPSPNGLLHLGHAYSALLNARLAVRTGGRLLLRLEDIDRDRCRDEYAAAIADDLSWLGLRWDGPVLRQSAHLQAYRAALDRLAAAGLLYPCFCTRGTVANAVAGRADRAVDPDGVPLYPGTCRHLDGRERARRLAAGAPAARRLDMAAALARSSGPLDWQECGEGDPGRTVTAAPAAWGDVVLARRDVYASYHVAVVVDDARQGVTDVVRGRDLFFATGLHRLLQDLLGLPAPRYRHHDLVLDAAGHKLAKSRGAPSLRALRRDGTTPAGVRALLGLG